MATTKTTRVFINGNSQAVRIPREFHLKTGRVQISQDENGDIVLHPIPDQPTERAEHLMDILAQFDEADVAAFEQAHHDQGDIQERETL